MARDWIILTPYRPPGRYPLSPGRDTAAAWLNAVAAAWHPSALRDAERMPSLVDPADHPDPVAGTAYVIPDSPDVVSAFWIDQAIAAGCRVVRATADRTATLADFPAEADAPAFAGLGLAYHVLESLCEAMEHEFILDGGRFWDDVRSHRLQSAAEQLQAAREVLYPVEIHWLEFHGWPASGGRQPPGPGLVHDSMEDQGTDASRSPFNPIVTFPCGDRHAPINGRLDAWVRAIREHRDSTIAWIASHGPEWPQWASLLGLTGTVSPAESRTDAAVRRWSSADGRTVDVLTRPPLDADDPEVIFHLAHHLHHTIMTDTTAVLPWRRETAEPAFADLIALHGLAPVFGRWNRVSRFLEEVGHQLYAEPRSADDIPDDTLTERAVPESTDAVSGYAAAVRAERRVDAERTYDALAFSLGVSDGDGSLDSATRLARRLTAKVTGGEPGLLVLNPCGFARRVPVEWPGCSRRVVEVPPLGFAWVRREEPKEDDTTRQTVVARLSLRNEFFVAEIDADTGGLRGLLDPRDRVNRLGQQLVWQPGSVMKASSVAVTIDEPALGEITSTGELVGPHGDVLAAFRQQFRAWRGRPLLELRIELTPRKAVSGSPWHAYFGSRFAWRDERTVLRRGVCGRAEVTTHARPVSPDFVELVADQRRTLILPGGLPFHQRHGPRMLDTILIPPGESASAFEMAFGLDRPQPMQTALGFTSPVAVVECDHGPPKAGATGWLAHLDANNLALLGLRRDNADVIARMIELSGHAGMAEFRWAKPPSAAELTDARGDLQYAASVNDDIVAFEYAAHDLVHVRMRWG